MAEKLTCERIEGMYRNTESWIEVFCKKSIHLPQAVSDEILLEL
jgi:hypothetical protein